MTDESEAGFVTLTDLEEAAARKASPAAWAYVQGGSGDERTYEANREAFRRRPLLPRVLSGVRVADLSSSLLGTPTCPPLFVAPMAYQGLVHPEAEAATARATAAAGILGMCSPLSALSLEPIARAGPGGVRWFQLYLQPRFSQNVELVRRAERAGYRAIVLTADTPMLAARDRQ